MNKLVLILPLLLVNFFQVGAQVQGGLIQSSPSAEQQVNPQALNPIINSPEVFLSPSENPNCPIVNIYNRLYSPVSLAFFYDKTNNVRVERNATFAGSQIQVQSTSTTTNIYTDNTTNNFRFHVVISYDNQPDAGKTRAVSVQILSNNQYLQSFTDPINGLTYCREFSFWTSTAPTQPTIEDLIGKAGVEAIQNMQYIVPTVNKNTDTIYTGIFMQGIYGGILVIVILAWIFSRFYNQKKKRAERLKELADADLIHRTVVQTAIQSKQITVNFEVLADKLIKNIEERFARNEMYQDLSLKKIMEHTTSGNKKAIEELDKIKKNLEIQKIEKPKEEKPAIIDRVRDGFESIFTPMKKEQKEQDKRTDDEKLIDNLKIMTLEDLQKHYSAKYSIWEKNPKDQKIIHELGIIANVINEMIFRESEKRK